jgi:hypothetical protein
MNIGALAWTMKWVAKGRAKSRMQTAPVTSTYGTSPEKLDVSAGTIRAWREMMKGSVLIEKDLRFETNFSNDIFDIIAEAELMEQLGFVLEPVIRSVAVQKDRLHRDLQSVQNMVTDYNSLVENLTTAEVRFLISDVPAFGD